MSYSEKRTKPSKNKIDKNRCSNKIATGVKYFVIMKWPMYQEDTRIINICTLNNIGLKYMKQRLKN